MALYDYIYNFIISLMGEAMTYQSTGILMRYISMGLTLAIFFGLIYLLCLFFKILIKAFRG